MLGKTDAPTNHMSLGYSVLPLPQKALGMRQRYLDGWRNRDAECGRGPVNVSDLLTAAGQIVLLVGSQLEIAQLEGLRKGGGTTLMDSGPAGIKTLLARKLPLIFGNGIISGSGSSIIEYS